MKKITAIILLVALTLTMVSSALAVATTTTIPAASSAKGGSSVNKATTGEPTVEFSNVSRGSKITFWVWRDNYGQVTPTYTFTSYGTKDVYYMPEKDVITGVNYHPVWKKAQTVQNNQSVVVTYEFTP